MPALHPEFQKRIFASLCLLWFLAGTWVQAGQLEKITFTTDWFAQAEHGGFYQALAEGIYAKHGLDVKIRIGGPQINGMQLLLGGAAEFVTGSGFELLYAAERGLPAIAVMANFQVDPQVLLVHPDQPVKTLSDLQGYKIATSGITTYWPWLVREFGLNDNQRRPYNASITPFIVDKKMVTQGYATSEPYTAEKAGIKPKVLLLSDYGYTPYAALIVTSRKMVRQRPDLVRRFVAATRLGWISYFQNPAPANRRILQANREMSQDRIDYGIQAMQKYGLVQGGDAARFGVGIMTHERWQATKEFMVHAGLIDADTNVADIYTLDFVPPLAVTDSQAGNE